MRVRALLSREVREILRSPALLGSMASLPVTVVAVPLVLAAYLLRVAPDATWAFVREIYHLGAQDPASALVEALARTWLPIFLLLPVFIPILISSHSVGGERERRTLEPLLATPASTTEIVVAKSLASVLPAQALAWLAAVAFIVGLDLLAGGPGGRFPLPDTAWVVGVVLLSPLLSVFGNAVAVAISARVRDPRAAQNLAAMTVVPLLGLGIAQLAGSVRLEVPFYLAAALALALADVGLVLLAARLFDRERLLR